jgi:hypothetical protein
LFLPSTILAAMPHEISHRQQCFFSWQKFSIFRQINWEILGKFVFLVLIRIIFLNFKKNPKFLLKKMKKKKLFMGFLKKNTAHGVFKKTYSYTF